MLQIEQVFAISHLLQLSADRQETHPIPLVILQVFPTAQQPCDKLWRKAKPELQDAHWFDASHRAQLRVEGQVTHPTLEVALKVNPETHTAQALATSQRMQLREEGQSTHPFVVALIVFPAEQREHWSVTSHRTQLRDGEQDMHVPVWLHVKAVGQQPGELTGLI
jgi:hypothetical protein